MTQATWSAVAVAVAAVVGLSGGPVFLLPLVVAAAITSMVVRRRSPLSRPLGEPRRGRAWAVAAGVAALPGIVILASAQDELSEPAWAAMALSLLVSLGLLVAAASTMMAKRSGPVSR